jgi:hypothetical protein
MKTAGGRKLPAINVEGCPAEVSGAIPSALFEHREGGVSDNSVADVAGTDISQTNVACLRS